MSFLIHALLAEIPRVTDEWAGYAADYCLYCRKIRTCVVYRVFRYVPAQVRSGERGDLLHSEAECPTCHLRFTIDATAHRGCTGAKNLALADLISQTNPSLTECTAERLAREARARAGKLSALERGELLREPLTRIGPFVNARTSMSTPAKLRLALIPLLAMMVAAALRQGWSALLWAVVAWLILSIVIGLRRRHFIRRQVLPGLARALHPLRPTRAELETTLAHLGESAQACAKWISPAELFAAIGLSSLADGS